MRGILCLVWILSKHYNSAFIDEINIYYELELSSFSMNSIV